MSASSVRNVVASAAGWAPNISGCRFSSNPLKALCRLTALSNATGSSLRSFTSNSSYTSQGTKSSTTLSSKYPASIASANLRPQSLTRSYTTAIVKKPKFYVHALNVQDNKGASKKKKRVGRGLGGGKGKTSGRGQKGWKARQRRDRPLPGYEGGQTGLLKAIPKLGFRQSKKLRLARLRMDTLQHWIDSGRLNANEPITIRHLVQSRCVGSVKDGVVLLATGGEHFNSKIEIELTHASKAAIELVESKGGKLTCFDYDRTTIRVLLKPERFLGPLQPSDFKSPRINPRYFDPARRGYLASKVEELMELSKPK